MKKLLSIILTTVIIMSAMAIPAFADQPYYPCYEGTWNIRENSGTPIKLKISNVNSHNMDIYFQYGQFAINTTGKIDGKKVNANYREVWEGGDFIVSGTITLDLGDQGIWLDWHAYENGRDCGTDGYMFYNSSFKYKSAINDSVDITVELNGSQLDLEQNPIMVNDSVLLPIRAVAESMGAEVTWTEGVRKIGNVVGIQKDSRYIGFCVEDTGYNENYNPYHMMIRDGDQEGRFVKLYAPVTLYNGYTMVPIRAVTEAFGADVTWNGVSRTVNILTDKKTQSTSNSSNNTTKDYSKYIGVWAEYTFSDDIPETELIINNIDGNKVDYEIMFYRLAGYYNQTAYIDDNGVINFKTVENEGSSQPIQGTITLSGDSVTLNITSSEQSYLTPRSIEFYIKTTKSILGY